MSFCKILNFNKTESIKTYIYLILFLLLILFLANCASPQKSSSKELAQVHLRLGTNHLENGLYPEALKDLLTAESYDSTDPLIQNNLGLAYFMRDKYDLAEIHLKNAVKLESSFTDAKNNLSRVLIEKNNLSEAKSYIKDVLNDLTYSYAWKAYINLGLAQFKESNFKEAKESFLTALNSERENCLAANYYARSLLELKNYKPAVVAFEKAEAYCLKSKFDEPSYFSALNFYRMGDAYKAKLKFESLIERGSSFKEKSEQMLELLKK